MTDNATNFPSAEFANFATMWNFNHVTSSPRYAQSNGKAKNAVRTVERLFQKCKDSGDLEFVALELAEHSFGRSRRKSSTKNVS